MNLYLATNGNDDWSGQQSQRKHGSAEGPLATFQGAVRRLRALKDSAALDGPVTIWARGGVYPLAEPLRFAPEDSWPVTFAAYKDERPILDGGRRITEWQTTKHAGRAAWVADLPEVRKGDWNFRQLFVNGRRAPRPRLPKQGLFSIVEALGVKLPLSWPGGGQTQIVCAEGDAREFRNLSDAEVVYLHTWIEERSSIAAYDPARRLVTLARPSRQALTRSGSGDYYFDNVFEALTEPGEWYLDRPAGRLYYLPRRGERPDNTEVCAPRLLQLVKILGEPEERRYVEHVRFRGLTFRNTDWRHPGEETGGQDPDTGLAFGRGRNASANQAASDVPGVVRFIGAQHCGIEDCAIENVGWYGVEIGDGCRDVRVVGNLLRDLGAGGVRINGAAARDHSPARQTGHLCIRDNEVREGGRVFHSAVGILSMNAHDVEIAHNHVHDFFYSGISCGWEWGYQENASYNNHIEFNHIHDIGQKMLDDLGGIYTLGVQPGTVIRGNLVHGVRSSHALGWGIYLDEGSSHMLIERNVCYDTSEQTFHLHYGRENIVRNNIFAFGGDALASYTRREPHNGFTFERNILISDGKPIWLSWYTSEADVPRFLADLNLIWDLRGRRQPFLLFREGRRLSLAAWQRLGHEQHSVVADPKCRAPRKGDFTLAKDSPAWSLGFEPIDLSTVGPIKARKARGHG